MISMIVNKHYCSETFEVSFAFCPVQCFPSHTKTDYISNIIKPTNNNTQLPNVMCICIGIQNPYQYQHNTTPISITYT